MSLALDPRQRAMLEEMGVKVWWPAQPVAAEAPVPIAAPVQAAEPAQPAEPPAAPAAPRADVPIAPDRPAAPPPRAPAPAPTASAAAPAATRPVALTSAVVCVDTPLPLFATDAGATGGWLVLADMTPEADGRHAALDASDPGRLLTNMLRALRLDVAAVPVHLVRTHRGQPAGDGSNGGNDAEGGPRAFDAAFAAQAAALAPCVVLALGPLAAQSLLQSGEPLGRLRGRIAESALVAGVPVAVSYHPAYLLRNPADKARAWADLCAAAAAAEAMPARG